MNGARSTLMRKGYLLTALAAAALLAVSPGMVAAQNTTGVTITGPSNNTVNEGGTAAYTVAVRGYVDAATAADSPTAASRVTVTLAEPTVAGTGTPTEGELADLNGNAHVLVVHFDTPRNTSTVNPLLFTGSKTISLATLHDNDAENEQFTIAFTLTADGGLDQGADNDDTIALADSTGTPALARYNPVALTIDDDETQGYALTRRAGQTPTEGTLFNVDLTASPAHVNGSGTLQVVIDKQSGWTLAVEGETGSDGATTVDSTADGASRELAITQTAGDRNRVTDTVTVSAHTGVAGASREQASLSIDVADANTLQAVTAKVTDKDGKVLDPQPESVEEGKSVHIAVMPVDKDGKVTTANEALTITLESSGSADSRDFRLSAPITITSGQTTSAPPVMLTAETDEDVGMETLMLDATVSGEPANGTETSTSAGVLTLHIVDATEKSITPKATDADYDRIKAAIAAGAGDDEMLNPGEMVELMTADLFTVAEGYTGSYSVSVEGNSVSASASGEEIHIEAMVAGESKVTVTGTARMASSLMADQTVSNVASLTFPVEVVDKEQTIMLGMPDNVMDGNVVEGHSYNVPVHLNRAVTEAEGSLEITFGRDRSQSDADESDYSIADVTIMAGDDHAYAELMITEDMMDDAGHADGEQLVIYAMAGDVQSNDLTLTIWDEAVPALPLIAQVLLALFMMAGGARLYRRRQG